MSFLDDLTSGSATRSMRNIRYGMREAGRTFGTGEALIGGHINGAERARYEATHYRYENQSNRAEARMYNSDVTVDQARRQRDAYLNGQQGYGTQFTQQGYGQGQPQQFSQPAPQSYGQPQQGAGGQELPQWGASPQSSRRQPMRQPRPGYGAPLQSNDDQQPDAPEAPAAAPAAAPTQTQPGNSTPPSAAPISAGDIPQGDNSKVASVGAGKPPHADMPNVTTKAQVQWLQTQLNKTGDFNLSTAKSQDGVDGLYGSRTHAAALAIAADAKVKLSDVDFNNPADPETAKFLQALNTRVAAKAAPQQGQQQTPPQQTPPQQTQPVQGQGQPDQGTAREDRAADRAAQRAAIEAREIPELRGTPFSSTSLARMGEESRYYLARDVLLQTGELKHENKQHNFENMHDKLKEAVRDANKILGRDVFRAPIDKDHPFTNDAMAALGVIAAHEGAMPRSQQAQAPAADPMQLALQRAREQGVGNTTITGGQHVGERPESAQTASAAPRGPQLRG